MAEIKAFKALRFNTEKAGKIEDITCPPYDIISEEERIAFIKKNPFNVIRLELPREGEDPYKAAGDVLGEWEKYGILRRDLSDSLYIYEEEFEALGERKSIRGLICLVKLEEFSKGIVLPHEETLSKAKTDRFNLMKATNCNFSQIYSLYSDPERVTICRIDEFAKSDPEIEMTDSGGVIHRLWKIEDENLISDICKDFSERKLYIADGHHRYETALNFRNYLNENSLAQEGGNAGYVMMTLVDMENDGLVVFPTHRLIRDLPNFDEDKLCEKSLEYFDIESFIGTEKIEPVLRELYEEGKKAFALYLGTGKWKLFTLKSTDCLKDLLPNCSDALRELDVTVLHSLVLEKYLGIDKENMAQQTNLIYTRVFREAIEKVDSGEYRCAFLLNPTRVTEIRDVAANDEKMPQKSTYFYPKIITGLVMNKIQEK